MKNLDNYKQNTFESIKMLNEKGQEYWSARELAKILDYSEYRKFNNVIEKAKKACQNSQNAVENHFAHVADMVKIGSGAKREIEDIHLSRYACYLIVQNADASKAIVALGQTYFAVQTRRQELSDNAEFLPSRTI